MFKDRIDAARQLADKLQEYKDKDGVVIIAIPRGALEIGAVLSRRLNVPLDVVFSKKIGAPGNPEYAIGAVSLEDRILDHTFVSSQGATSEYIENETERIRELLRKRMAQYYKDRRPCDLKNKIVIITDDGMATGRTLSLTVDLIKRAMPKKIIVALPVGPKDAVEILARKVDQMICLLTPSNFHAVGQFYQQFAQVEDDQAIKLLHEAQSCDKE